MLEIFYLLFVLPCIFFLPGYLISRLSSNKNCFIAVFALGWGLSIILIPIVSFSIAMLLHTVIDKQLVFIAASLINIMTLALIIYKRLANNHVHSYATRR